MKRSRLPDALRTTTALALMTICAPAMAQQIETQTPEPETMSLAPVTLLADRQGTSTREVPASVTVIDGEEIRARGLDDMQELVRYTPGVTVQRQTTATDPFNTFGGFTIRGVGGNRVQMLIDGSRVPERITDGTRDYLDFAFTKQVEIAKGPSSVLWGADALGGVVAVETIDPEDLLQGRDSGGMARMAYDSLNDGSSISGAFAQRFGNDWSIMAGLSRSAAHEAELSNARNDGGIYGCPRNVEYGATPCGELNPTDTDATHAIAKAVWKPSDEHRLELSFDWLDRKTEVQYDNTLGPVYSTMTGLPTGEVNHNYDRDLDMTRKRFGLEYVWTPENRLVDEVRTTLAYTPSGYDRSGKKWSTSSAGDQMITRDYLGYDEDFVELDIQATSRFETGSAKHTVTWGFDGDHTKTDYSRLDVASNLTTGDVTETPAGGFNFANADTRRADIYVQDQISLLGGALEITPGLRYATYKIDPRPNGDYQVIDGAEPRIREDEKLLKSLGALYRFGDGWQVWGHYGEGFKMPTAQQLYTSVPGAFFDMTPAPDLKPEEVKSIEFGLRRETARGYFGLTAFNADYDNFIQSFYNPPGTSDYTYRNLSEMRVWGLEFEAAYEISDTLRLTGAASWQKGDQRVDPDAEETPTTLPPLSGNVALSWDTPQDGLTVDVVGVFASSVKYVESEDNFKPAGYGLIDTYARWQVAENAVLNMGVRNLFDKRYFEASAATYSSAASTSVAASNPIELQTGAGRAFTASLDFTF
ncbi:TonB-dependent hemoglobin/transferrin/lactoferrin family receptor [Paracoccus aestuariivivens]|uniref:TonB-dependent hemoglobin/transferrin/lactoferrin family receptor n=1 Tax=Paracoccus aestuariivivens TaxID=1820333 RepID=A0A6L6JB91_9RHOB|nr:TonB-dependent hemoglobin/transferrin/lactoferrin family receptor [Paracoccus aestuariivivens]MTH78398.1 TonB-dependent hemoglobin/transferrin/lactoferrin family receptor [Paracoccus aestuariivivens]